MQEVDFCLNLALLSKFTALLYGLHIHSTRGQSTYKKLRYAKVEAVQTVQVQTLHI